MPGPYSSLMHATPKALCRGSPSAAKSRDTVTDERVGLFTPDKKRGTADGAGRAANLAARRGTVCGEVGRVPRFRSTHGPSPVGSGSAAGRASGWCSREKESTRCAKHTRRGERRAEVELTPRGAAVAVEGPQVLVVRRCWEEASEDGTTGQQNILPELCIPVGK